MARTFVLTRQMALLEDLLFVIVSHSASSVYPRMHTSRKHPTNPSCIL